MVVVAEQRCIARHNYYVGIAFYIGQVHSLDEGIGNAVALRCPFTQIDLCALAVVTVVEILMVEVPARSVVVVFVNDFDVVLTGCLPSVFVVAAFPERTDSADDGNLRMGCLHSVDEEEVALHEGVADKVFVADAEILEVEWFRVTSLGTYLSQFAGLGIAVCPLDEVEQFLQVRLHSEWFAVIGIR